MFFPGLSSKFSWPNVSCNVYVYVVNGLEKQYTFKFISAHRKTRISPFSLNLLLYPCKVYLDNAYTALLMWEPRTEIQVKTSNLYSSIQIFVQLFSMTLWVFIPKLVQTCKMPCLNSMTFPGFPCLNPDLLSSTEERNRFCYK